VKLILANNQTEQFVNFYKSLQQKSPEPFDYSSYSSLLFIFDNQADQPVTVINLATSKKLNDYDGVYINGYLNTYELAATVAICCDALGVSYVNKELHNAPSLSKLTAYAKLTEAKVRIPKTLAGSKSALLQSGDYQPADLFPAILKRADADRGIDNFKVKDQAEVAELLKLYDDQSIWILQEFIENDGFYLVSFYDNKPAFCIFRSLEERPDGDERKAHMFKPKGGANASLIELAKVPQKVIDETQKAIKVMNRQIGSVDCLYDQASDEVYILEVNYNPQLVTIETFKDVRVNAFLQNLNKRWE
jgi:glutathione synthase/RimK-type ligase-like ATP-grasp enzyme